MPTSKDASIQTVLKYTNINFLLDECNNLKVSELRLNGVVDDLRSKVPERKSKLTVDVKTRFYTRLYLPWLAVFMALLKFMEPYIAVACQSVSDLDNS